MTIEEFEKEIFKSCFLLPSQIQWSYKYTTPEAPASHLEYKITAVFPTKISWSDISVEEYKELEQIVIDDMVVSPIFYEDARQFIQNDVKGFQTPAFGPYYEFRWAYKVEK